MMYCSIQEAWNTDNTIESFLNKRQCDRPAREPQYVSDPPPQSHLNRNYTYNSVNDIANNMRVDPQTNQVIGPESPALATLGPESPTLEHFDTYQMPGISRDPLQGMPLQEIQKLDTDSMSDFDFTFSEESQKDARATALTTIENTSLVACDDALTHLDKCKSCQDKVVKKYQKKSPISGLLSNENKEFITVILVGIFIIMILDLFVRLGQSLSKR